MLQSRKYSQSLREQTPDHRYYPFRKFQPKMLSMTFSTRFTPLSTNRLSRQDFVLKKTKVRPNMSLFSKVLEADTSHWESNRAALPKAKKQLYQLLQEHWAKEQKKEGRLRWVSESKRASNYQFLRKRAQPQD